MVHQKRNSRRVLHHIFGFALIIFVMLCISEGSTASASNIGYISLNAAIEQVRNAMILRKESISLRVESNIDFYQDNAVSTYLVYPAFADNTGSRYDAGDYLESAWSGHTSLVAQDGKGKWRIEIYDMHYHTELSQEKEFDAALKEAIDELDVWSTSDALKCQAIYDFITSHVSYDYEAYEGVFPDGSTRKQLSYTAYAALLHERSVCAGYAQLFYAMAHSVGVPVRIVHGEANGKNGWASHAWNAVELDGCWYQLDCTWDEHGEREEWEYFLKGKEMPKHRITTSFSGMDRLAATDYVISSHDYLPVSRFKDISVTDSCYDAAQALSEKGVLTGTVNGYTFSPQDTVSRGMFVEVLYRFSGKPGIYRPRSFVDVAPASYYEDAIQWASGEGLVSGYEDGLFHPNDAICLEQMLTVLYRYYGDNTIHQPSSLSAWGIEGVSPYATEAMVWAINTRVISIAQLRAASPASPVTRSLLAEVIYTAYESFVDLPGEYGPSEWRNPYTMF